MKIELKVKKVVEVKTLQVNANVRYWIDGQVNGESDTESGDNVPCRDGENWCPEIDIETGKILNWKPGTTAEIHYKVVDGCGWSLKDENGEAVLFAEDGYVPDTLSPKESGYGDYIIMDIDENGMIADWRFDIRDFQEDNED